MFREDRPGWNPEWKTRFTEMHGYDPAKARALLAEAGYGPSNPLKHNLILVTTAYFAAAQDMAEAISGYWRAIGVDVNLQITDGAQRQLLTRSLELNNHSEVVGTSVRQLRGISVYGARSTLSTQNGVGLPETDVIFEQKVRVAVDPQKAEEAWSEFGNLAYERFMHVPLFWIPSEAVVDQNVVADYIFPGTITGLYTHVEYIKAAP